MEAWLVLRATMLPALLLAMALLAAAGTPGVFVGTIVECSGPMDGERWIYVQSRNGMVRKVESSGAGVVYGRSVPRRLRARVPREGLVTGAQVRVTAEQEAGEWRAREVEILRPAPK